MAYEWFISYRRKSGGENQARQVAEILSKYVGEDKVFYDRESMREGNWRDQINDALNSAEHFVLLVNEASAAEDQSNNIGGYRYEIEYALKNGKKISLIEYDKNSYDEVIKKYPQLKNVQKVTFNGEYNFASEGNTEPDDLADLYNAIAKVEEFTNNFCDAKMHHEKALEVVKSVKVNEKALERECENLLSDAMLCENSGDTESAIELYEEAVKIGRKLPETPYYLNS